MLFNFDCNKIKFILRIADEKEDTIDPNTAKGHSNCDTVIQDKLDGAGSSDVIDSEEKEAVKYEFDWPIDTSDTSDSESDLESLKSNLKRS